MFCLIVFIKSSDIMHMTIVEKSRNIVVFITFFGFKICCFVKHIENVTISTIW